MTGLDVSEIVTHYLRTECGYSVEQTQTAAGSCGNCDVFVKLDHFATPASEHEIAGRVRDFLMGHADRPVGVNFEVRVEGRETHDDPREEWYTAWPEIRELVKPAPSYGGNFGDPIVPLPPVGNHEPRDLGYVTRYPQLKIPYPTPPYTPILDPKKIANSAKAYRAAVAAFDDEPPAFELDRERWRPVMYGNANAGGPLHCHDDGRPLCGMFTARGYTEAQGERFCRSCLDRSGDKVPGAVL